MERVILHCDLNGFYASVECMHRPHLRDKYVCVGGDVEQRHGIILASNQKAKGRGIKTGMAIWQARQLCSNLITLPPNYKLYLRISALFRKILSDYSPQVEAFGLDENWVDITASMHQYGSGKAVADEVRQRVKDELGITCSVGVSFNKVFAKLGSDMKKPDATTVITKENFRETVWPLPVGDLLYVGRATKEKLERMVIETIGDLANADPKRLQSRLGKWGNMLYAFANGWDTSPVSIIGEEGIIKGIGNSATTPRDLHTHEDVSLMMYVLGDSVAMRLRNHGFIGNVIEISMRTNELYSFTRQKKIARYTGLVSDIHDTAMLLARENYRFDKPLRSVGVRVTGLIPASGEMQLTLFDDLKRKNMEKLQNAVFDLRERYGNQCVKRAVLLSDNMGKLNPKDDHTIHPVSFIKGAI